MHEFDFFELVLTNHATRVLPVRSRFRTEARRMCHESLRQLIRFENCVACLVGERHFGRRNQVIRPLFRGLEQVCCKFWQLSCADERMVEHEIGYVGFVVIMFADMRIEHELNQRSLQSRQCAAHDCETRTRDLARAVEIQQTQAFTQIDMIFHLKVEFARRTPAS